VNRGGSWNNSAQNARSAERNCNEPGNANNNLGFRPALAASSAARVSTSDQDDHRCRHVSADRTE
jgi:hypothetical protein